MSAPALQFLVDELVADYVPVVGGFDETLHRREDHVFSAPTPSLLEQISALKWTLLHFRRIIAPQREALNKLSRADHAVIDAKDCVFFWDVHDHLVRLYDTFGVARAGGTGTTACGRWSSTWTASPTTRSPDRMS
jgi:magnesium transporter